MEDIDMEKGCNYRQQVGSCDRLLAMAAVKLNVLVTDMIYHRVLAVLLEIQLIVPTAFCKPRSFY
jgi:hypothetical protein